MGCIQCTLSMSTNFPQKNFGTLSETKVLGIPFFENIVLNICFTVLAFLIATLITSGHPENESTRIKNNPMTLIWPWSFFFRSQVNYILQKFFFILAYFGHLFI